MKSALVTGAADRIGKSISLKLASMGYNIALHYHRSEEKATETKKEVEKFKVKCELFKKDFSIEKDIISLSEEVYEVFPDLNLLVNSASIFIRRSIIESDIDIFNRIMSINFKAPFFLTKDFGKKTKSGNIINILDTKITEYNSNYAIYNLSKKNLYELTLMSAKEFAPGIRVNGIAPGLILPPVDSPKKYLDDLAKKIPLKKKGDINDITNSIEYLLNNEYITGQVLFINGGQHLQ